MKKILAILLAAAMLVTVCVLASCNKQEETTQTTQTQAPVVTEADTTAQQPSVDVLSHEQYVAAALETKVVIESYVQGKQSWWDNKATLYLESPDGAYFVYNVACSEADYAKLVKGTKIRVTGVKAEWAGEVEITDGTFEILSGDTYVAEATDITSKLGTDDLIKHQNEFVSFKKLVVLPSLNADGENAAFLYNWNGSGEPGNDLYFKVGLDGFSYTFTVESYLCDKDSEVYKAVEALEIGDVIDLEGFLYWYNGVNPHITKVTKTEAEAMTYEQYEAAELDTLVTIYAFVQAKQSWWDNKATVYLMDGEGGYFAYNMVCAQEDYDKLVPGQRIKVTGVKAEWAGEVEITDATFEFADGKSYIAEAVDLTALLGEEEALYAHKNEFVAFKNLTVVAQKNPDGEDVAFLYNWNGSGEPGNDLYFKVANEEGTVFTFTVESYLCDKDSEVYKAVEALTIGQKINVKGFLYWYNGLNPHITEVTTAE